MLLLINGENQILINLLTFMIYDFLALSVTKYFFKFFYDQVLLLILYFKNVLSGKVEM